LAQTSPFEEVKPKEQSIVIQDEKSLRREAV